MGVRLLSPIATSMSKLWIKGKFREVEYVKRENWKADKFKNRNKKSTWSRQCELLNIFYEECRLAPMNYRINKLIEMTKLTFVNPRPYTIRRGKTHPIRKSKKCFSCRTKRAKFNHHIIQISRGGYDSGNNRVPICEECHSLIHPWLENEEVRQIENNMTNEYLAVVG